MKNHEKNILRIILMQAVQIMEKLQRHFVNFNPEGFKNEDVLFSRNIKEIIKLMKKSEASLRW